MITIEYWWVLWLLPLPILVRLILPRDPINANNALEIPFFSRLASFFSSASFSLRSSLLNLFIASLIWITLVVAASNPLLLGEPIIIDQSGRAIMLAVDLSGSMKQGDMAWRGRYARRVDVVKSIADAFIESRTGDRVGLILFGSNAYLQAPITFDRKTVKDMLDDATVGLAGQQTAIGDAIGLAVKSLNRYEDKEKILILLTDGANNAGHVDPMEVASVAAKNNIRIYTIGLGANRVSGFGILSSDLDEDSLQKISKTTGGLFFRATSADDLKKVYSQINKLVPVKSDQTYLQPKQPLYPWLLGFALCLMFISSLWRLRQCT